MPKTVLSTFNERHILSQFIFPTLITLTTKVIPHYHNNRATIKYLHSKRKSSGYKTTNESIMEYCTLNMSSLLMNMQNSFPQLRQLTRHCFRYPVDELLCYNSLSASLAAAS